jgi:hypothetical protein
MNAIELNTETEQNTIDTNELNTWNITKKAVKHFREYYKDNKKDLSLGDFMMYAIIKNRPLAVTIYDNHYAEDKNPLDYHRKFIREISSMAILDSSILTTFKEPKNKIYHGQSSYVKQHLIARYKKLFGLDEDEINFVITQYVIERKAS